MEYDGDEEILEMSKNELKVMADIISEVTDNPSNYTTGDQLFSLFSTLQVRPEKQLKLMYAVALKLSNLSEKVQGEISNQYLRLSTLATEAVQEKFGLTQQETSSRRGRQAKDNAKINMTSYFDLETTLLNEDSDNESQTKNKKRGSKVKWSDSELQETGPLPKSPKRVEEVEESDSNTPATNPTPQNNQSKSSALTGPRVSQRKRMIDIVCIDSSSEEESINRKEVKGIPRRTQKSKSTKKTKSIAPEQSKPKAPISDAGIARVFEASNQPTSPATKTATKESEKSSETGSKSKPVGVVKATPRAAPMDTQRSVNNIIKQDEALILNFKKGHYPTFQTSYTHLVVCKKDNNDLYTDSAPRMDVILAMDGQVVPSEQLRDYELKQFVHNDSGQYLLGSKGDDLYLLVPGVINKNKIKT